MNFEVESTIVKAHKCIVFSRNEAFKLLLTSDLALESTQNTVSIENVSVKVFR